MRYLRWLLGLGLLVASCSQGLYMNQERYAAVRMGEPITSVMQRVGRPYERKEADDGPGLDYVFIERFEVTRGVTEHVRYTIKVVDGFVVDKEARRVESYPDINFY